MNFAQMYMMMKYTMKLALLEGKVWDYVMIKQVL